MMSKKISLFVIFSIILLLCACGIEKETKYDAEDIVEDNSNVVTISIHAMNSEKYENFLCYDSTLVYSLPYDLSDSKLKWEKDYKKYLEKNVEDDEKPFEEQWNWHVYLNYYRPSYYYIQYKKDGDFEKYLEREYHYGDKKDDIKDDNQHRIDAGIDYSVYYYGTEYFNFFY